MIWSDPSEFIANQDAFQIISGVRITQVQVTQDIQVVDYKRYLLQCKRHIYTACFPAAEKRALDVVSFFGRQQMFMFSFLPSKAKVAMTLNHFFSQSQSLSHFLEAEQESGITCWCHRPCIFTTDGERGRRQLSSCGCLRLRITRFEGWLSASRC